MKFSEGWLREWVNPSVDTAALGAMLTSAGLELDAVEVLADDKVIELGITANRGDCLSIRGIAREVGVSARLPVATPELTPVTITHQAQENIKIDDAGFCPRYAGRLITGVNAGASTPDWMADRLKKAGLNAISLVVDILNYVMLEWGQPLHAFDADTLSGDIHVRLSQGEKVVLLDGSTVTLDKKTWVIADDKNPIAIAGVMGTQDSSVQTHTKQIFIESAYFNASMVMGKARAYGLTSDAATRFERGVDYELPITALNRATALILELAGGSAGPVTVVETASALPTRKPITLDHDKLCQALGMDIPVAQVQEILERLGCVLQPLSSTQFSVTAPSYRFDISIAQDLYEEVLRVVGLNQVPEALPEIKAAHTPSEAWHRLSLIKDQLLARGYTEVITYSFVDEILQQQLLGPEPAEKLLNPISQDMNVMRLSIWPGLIQTLRYNQNRQHMDMKIVETGQCFKRINGELTFDETCAGLVAGQAAPTCWDGGNRPVDFYDIKGDVEALLDHTGLDYRFEAEPHPALHPGISAAVMVGNECIGYLGALHPALAHTLDIKTPTFMFELKLAALQTGRVPKSSQLSKFPTVRRDLALLLDKDIPAQTVIETIEGCAGSLLSKVEVFDLYQGKNIAPSKKSLALALILQETSRTLIDTEVNNLMQVVVNTLVDKLQATVRE